MERFSEKKLEIEFNFQRSAFATIATQLVALPPSCYTNELVPLSTLELARTATYQKRAPLYNTYQKCIGYNRTSDSTERHRTFSFLQECSVIWEHVRGGGLWVECEVKEQVKVVRSWTTIEKIVDMEGWRLLMFCVV